MVELCASLEASVWVHEAVARVVDHHQSATCLSHEVGKAPIYLGCGVVGPLVPHLVASWTELREAYSSVLTNDADFIVLRGED